MLIPFAFVSEFAYLFRHSHELIFYQQFYLHQFTSTLLGILDLIEFTRFHQAIQFHTCVEHLQGHFSNLLPQVHLGFIECTCLNRQAH